MYLLEVQSKFKKDLKAYNQDKKTQMYIKETLNLLVTGNPLPKKYNEHKLIGDYVGWLECHIKPDLLIIFARDHTNRVIKLYRIGSHAKLFK